MKPLNLNNLSAYYKSWDIIQKTAEQIQKDFSLFSIEINFSSNPDTAYDELFSQLLNYIEHLLASKSEKLWSILYQIDLGEKVVHDTLTNSDNPNAELAEKIIDRELKKVIIREYYKTNDQF